MTVRIKTNYPGIFAFEGKRVGGKGTEEIISELDE